MTRSSDTPERRVTLDRIEGLLSERSIREVLMFGAVAVMVDDAMVVAVSKDGSLLVRVDPDDDAHLVQQQGAARAEMGARRSMGEGWVRVRADAITDDDGLRRWVGHAMRYHARRGAGV